MDSDLSTDNTADIRTPYMGERIVDYLACYGVEKVFGIPGTHSIELYRGLEDSPIEHILTRHEQGAGFMADGYARQSGKPGVCFVITGPGATNALTAIAQAYSDSVPMLIFSPMNDVIENHFNLGRLHEIGDQSAVFKPVTGFSEIAYSERRLRELIDQAFELFSHQRPRPVHIHLPLSLLRARSTEKWQRPVARGAVAIDERLIAKAIEQLEAAKSPVMVVGGGCRGLGAKAVGLAERIGCPMVATVAGRAEVPVSHALAVGAQLAAPQVLALVAGADVVLVLGSELAEPDHWTTQLELPMKQIWVNLDEQLLQHHKPFLAIQASVGPVLDAINQQISRVNEPRLRQQYRLCKSIRDQHGARFTPVQKTHWRVLTEIVKQLPKPSAVCSDMTQIAYTAVEHLPLAEGINWFHPNGYGTLGYALPAAIGAKIAEPDNRVLCLVGDAGFQYTVAELGVAAERELNVVVLLWQNNALQQIADDMVDANISPNAVHQQNPDFTALAKSYGWQAHEIAGLAALGGALEQAFLQSGPVMLVLDAANC